MPAEFGAIQALYRRIAHAIAQTVNESFDLSNQQNEDGESLPQRCVSKVRAFISYD